MAIAMRETRESQARKKVWEPPNKLRTPAPPEGYKYRYVRRQIKGLGDDHENVLARKAQHYEPVHPSEIKLDNVRTMEDGKDAGAVINGDLILMKVPTEIADQRTVYYQDKAEKMQEAVDNDLMKEGTKSMPVYKKRGTRVQLGTRAAKFEDDNTSDL